LFGVNKQFIANRDKIALIRAKNRWIPGLNVIFFVINF